MREKLQIRRVLASHSMGFIDLSLEEMGMRKMIVFLGEESF